MYTIKNISSKIIHIGTTILMPDQTMQAPEKTAKLPSIQAFAKRKMLEITAPKVEAPNQEEKNAQQSGEQADDANAEGEGESDQEQASDAAPKAKGARRTTKKAESKE